MHIQANEARLSPVYGAGGEYLVALLIFVVTLLIYLVSPVVTSSDAKFAMHVALSFYKGLHGDSTPWLPAIHATKQYQLYGFPLQLVTAKTGISSEYPIGTPLMVVPYVAVNDALGGHIIGSLEQNIAPWHDHIAASVISAAAVAVLYFACDGARRASRAPCWPQRPSPFAPPCGQPPAAGCGSMARSFSVSRWPSSFCRASLSG